MNRGIAICTYNRGPNLGSIIEAVLSTKPDGCSVVIADDGSDDNTFDVVSQYKKQVSYYAGVNKGVSANKNRALFALKGCDTLCIIEDDLMPTEKGWYEIYENFVFETDIHHLCRVQDKIVDEVVPEFTAYVQKKLGYTPIYGPSPRGDLTFITARVLREVGAFSSEFVGVGYAHGQWSNRAAVAGLCSHPNKWIDIKEARDKFIQVGDTTGGRWQKPVEEIQEQINKNREVRNRLGTREIFIPLELP